MTNVEIERVVRDFKSTMGLLLTEKPETANSLLNLIGSIHKDGALSVKEKELVSLGISICIGCETCIVLHTRSALEAGATRREIVEVFGVATALKGSSVVGDIRKSVEVLNKLSSRRS